jgi:hypothetical protein
MRTINWNFAHEKNTSHATWSVLSIKPAFEKIQRYWNVEFIQVSKNARLQIILTNSSRGKNVPMWQNGRRIFASAAYKWVNPDQMVLALVHEIGHWLVNGGGHIKQPGHVMSEVLGDPYVNFSKEDMRWFGRLPWKSKTRPWDAEEINFFRPMRGQTLDISNPNVIMNCNNFSIFGLFRGKK